MRQRSGWVGVFCCLLFLFAPSNKTAKARAPTEENGPSSATAAHPAGATSNIGATQVANPIYLGTFSSKGKFRGNTVLGRFDESMDDDPKTLNADRDVPPWLLTSRERVIKDSEVGAHTVEAASPHSRFWGLAHPIVGAIYGPVAVFHSPTYIATDPQNRLIVTDASDNSVHVLDPAGKNSFRIVAGPHYRLKHPEGVATDNDGNIYIADSATALVLEYDSLGRFVRRLGLYVDENIFDQPSGIAIDQRRSLLYVADSSANVVAVLDLRTGRKLRQFGAGHRRLGVPDLTPLLSRSTRAVSGFSMPMASGSTSLTQKDVWLHSCP